MPMMNQPMLPGGQNNPGAFSENVKALMQKGMSQEDAIKAALSMGSGTGPGGSKVAPGMGAPTLPSATGAAIPPSSGGQMGMMAPGVPGSPVASPSPNAAGAPPTRVGTMPGPRAIVPGQQGGLPNKSLEDLLLARSTDPSAKYNG